jgi:c-di-GMP-binding flagellar brake protein YcgR
MGSDDRADKRDLRAAPRIPLGCRLFFSNSEQLEGEATLLDLSKTGCAAESETAVQTDMSLDLWIFLPDYDWRMHIDHAVVRWVRGQVFGLEFLHLRPVQRERLRRLVEKLRSQSQNHIE